MSKVCSDRLVQIELPVGYHPVLEFARGLGSETVQERAQRLRRNKQTETFRLYEGNGATLAELPKLLKDQGLRLVDAYAQERIHPANENRRKAQSYVLLTFVFRKEGDELVDVLPFFVEYVSTRWDHIFVNEHRFLDDTSVITSLAKGMARVPLESKIIKDPDAEKYGIVVTKRIKKKNRPAHSASA